jgi:hypothetical protein
MASPGNDGARPADSLRKSREFMLARSSTRPVRLPSSRAGRISQRLSGSYSPSVVLAAGASR